MPDTSITKKNARYVFKASDEILNKIRNNPLYEDSNCHVNIIGSKLYIGLSITEFDNYFPSILDEENVSRVYLYDTPLHLRLERGLEIVSSFELQKKQDTLAEEGKLYLKSSARANSDDIKVPQSSTDDSSLIAELFNYNQGLCIGEVHKSYAAKKFLIDNMAQFQKQGVTTLFLEHIFSDTQTELLQQYLDSTSTEMPPLLSLHLDYLDQGHGLKNSNSANPYSFKGLVMTAKKYGINIIPIDSSIAYEQDKNRIQDPKDNTRRCAMMNYVAAQQFSLFKLEHPDEKYLFFVGSAHINNVATSIPGIAEIADCPTLIVEDGPQYQYSTNTKEHIVQPDMVIKINGKGYSDEAIAIQDELIKENVKTNKFKPRVQDTTTKITNPLKEPLTEYRNNSVSSEFELFRQQDMSNSDTDTSNVNLKKEQEPDLSTSDFDSDESDAEELTEQFSLKSSRFFISRKEFQKSDKNKIEDDPDKGPTHGSKNTRGC